MADTATPELQQRQVNSMTYKDIDITAIAILKSVIESGADSAKWDELTRLGLRTFIAVTTTLKSKKTNG